ncbi:MAG TPA: FAD-binding oxidoreductase [Polyangiaceae bacterium]|nr:FAD-binding oxidoreductase [Polyangiaceae bacterium]
MRIIVVGAGIMGVTSALELAERGHDVTLLDAGSIPHPDASSTDISKIVRLDYGDDAFYVALMERALELWRGYSEQFDEPWYHETGFALLTRRPMEAGGFEDACYRTLTARGHRLERLDADTLSARLPSWRPGYFVDGYYNPKGGWDLGRRHRRNRMVWVPRESRWHREARQPWARRRYGRHQGASVPARRGGALSRLPAPSPPAPRRRAGGGASALPLLRQPRR